MEKLKKLNHGATEFMKNQRKQLEKEQNLRVAKLEIGGQAGQEAAQSLKNKSRVPNEAAEVYDEIQLADQMKQLMKDLKFLVDDTKQAAVNVQIGEDALHTAKTTLNEKLKDKKLVVKNGTLEPLREKEIKVKAEDLDVKTLTAQAEAANQKKNPLEPIVRKLAAEGYDPEGAFDMLDDNEDGVLTKKEIQDGMKFHKIELTDEEWSQFMTAIDRNSDGVLDVDEWVDILAPHVEM
jgi:hypothetical protein